MTFTDVSKQIYNLAVDGWVDDQKFKCYTDFSRWFRKVMSDHKKTHIFRIMLPDGMWYGEAYRLTRNTYDYYLPETRAEEEKIRDKVFMEEE